MVKNLMLAATLALVGCAGSPTFDQLRKAHREEAVELDRLMANREAIEAKVREFEEKLSAGKASLLPVITGGGANGAQAEAQLAEMKEIGKRLREEYASMSKAAESEIAEQSKRVEAAKAAMDRLKPKG